MALFSATIFLPEIVPFIKERVTKLPEYGLAIGKNSVTARRWKKVIGRLLEKILPSRTHYQNVDNCS